MRIIDADGHVLEKQIPWADLLEVPYRDRAPKEVKDNRGFSFIMPVKTGIQVFRIPGYRPAPV